MGRVIQIEFGAMAPKLKKQLAQYRIDSFDTHLAQRMADGLALLRIHGVLSEAESRAGDRRLLQWLKERIDFSPV